jgi:hypothetical protein
VDWLVPNRFAADAIGALALRCTAIAEGVSVCPWTGPLRELASHRSTACAARPLQCPNAGCGVQAAAGAMDAHRAACGFERVPCSVPGCGVLLARNAVDAHMAASKDAHLQALTASFAEVQAELRNVRARLDAGLGATSSADAAAAPAPRSAPPPRRRAPAPRSRRGAAHA